RKERLDRCKAALLMGYFDSDSSDTPALDLACALSVTVKWAADEAALAEARGAWRLFARLFTPVMRRYFTRLIHGHLASGQSPRHSGSPRHDEPSGEALTPTRITS
ncbi:MAG TPA: hypothetical protein VER55_14895, partial [Ardenticatenaceae bacterium]|nr:hypothetical protein [Ardenticatenaceae bacterium]